MFSTGKSLSDIVCHYIYAVVCIAVTFNGSDHLETRSFFFKILTRAVRVPGLLDYQFWCRLSFAYDIFRHYCLLSVQSSQLWTFGCRWQDSATEEVMSDVGCTAQILSDVSQDPTDTLKVKTVGHQRFRVVAMKRQLDGWVACWTKANSFVRLMPVHSMDCAIAICLSVCHMLVLCCNG